MKKFKPNEMRVTALAHHRNGVCGDPFYVALIDWNDDEGRVRKMVATYRPEVDGDSGWYKIECTTDIAVFDIDELAKGNIAMAKGNSWRGDHFVVTVHKAVMKEQDKLKKQIKGGK